MRRSFFWIGIVSTIAFAADSLPQQKTSPAAEFTPWFTGTLLAESGTTYPVGHFSINNYLSVITNTGAYNQNWEAVSIPHDFTIINPLELFYAGLTPWCDFQMVTQLFYQTTAHKKSVQYGDLTCGLDFQLLDADATPYFPGIKFSLLESFPTGKYNRLNPDKEFTDGSGRGAFGTQVGLMLYKVYHLTGHIFLNHYFSATYTLQSPISIHGVSVYGGDPSTRGRAFGGDIFQAIFSFELALSQNWVFAMDNSYIHINSVSFSGTTESPVGKQSSEQICFAPAVEYNFNANWGIIAGYFFSAWGRSSPQFRSGVVNLECAY